MAHPLVEQLRFTRSEWLRALDGVTDEDARKQMHPMNTIGWIAGHLAWQEQRYWLTFSQGLTPLPVLNEIVGSGCPMTTPSLAQMLAAWRIVTQAADAWLDQCTTASLTETIPVSSWQTTAGSLMLRMIYHYWYHIGEIMAIRQQLSHPDLPDFVGALDEKAPYRAE